MLERALYFVGGLGLGILLSFSMLERYYSGLMRISDMLDEFKSEGHDDKWLK